MREYKTTYNGKRYRRIRKDVARRKFKEGETIHLLASNLRFGSMFWHTGWPIGKNHLYPNDFDSHVRDYVWYNCDNESGYYPSYYIEAL